MIERNTITEHQRQFLIAFSGSGKSLTHLAAELALNKNRFEEFSKMVYDQMEDQKFPPFSEEQNAEFLKIFDRPR